MLGNAVQKRVTLGATDLKEWRGRLRAWWEGEEWLPVPPETPPASGESTDSAVAREAGPPVYWSAERVDVAQRIWGREYLGPGGEVYARYLLKPLGLNPTVAVAEIGAELGGMTRLMHRSSGAVVRGFEPCPELARAGMALSADAGLSKGAAITPIDLSAPALKPGSFDRVILRDALHTVRDKGKLLAALAGALKKKGQLLLTDFVLSEGGAPPAEVGLWAAREPVASLPCNRRTVIDELETLKLSIDLVEDESMMLRQMILDRWREFQNSLRGETPDALRLDLVFQEGERWGRCVAALDTGALHYVRIVASV